MPPLLVAPCCPHPLVPRCAILPCGHLPSKRHYPIPRPQFIATQELEQSMPTVDNASRCGGRRLRSADKLPPGEKITVSLRMEGALRVRLEEAARASDRNLSQECARRLRRSFGPA